MSSSSPLVEEIKFLMVHLCSGIILHIGKGALLYLSQLMHNLNKALFGLVDVNLYYYCTKPASEALNFKEFLMAWKQSIKTCF